MRILHISEGGLPDPRVERMAATMADEGHEMVFLGGKPIRGQHLSVFKEARMVPLGPTPMIVLDPRIKRRWLKAIEQSKPDIIHAHNVIVGHFLIGSSYPAILDDHEHLSAQSFVIMSRPFIRRTAARVLVSRLPVWERKMASVFPVLTVSEGIADYYRKITDRVWVASNSPLLREVEWLEDPPERQGLVYMGSDFHIERFNPWRDMSGLKDILEFDVISGLPHSEMMRGLSRHEAGLLPYKPHPFQKVCSPNKVYEYLHAGLQVVLQENFSHIFEDNDFVHSFVNYDDIIEVVRSLPSVNHFEVMKNARAKYIWDKQVGSIKEAYKRA